MGSQRVWPSRPSSVFHSRHSVFRVGPCRSRWQRSLCDKHPLIISCALCQVLEKRQLGAQCPEETNKTSHRANAMAMSAEGCGGKYSWTGPVWRVVKSSLRRRLSVETRRVAWSVLASYWGEEGRLREGAAPTGTVSGVRAPVGTQYLGAQTSA